MRRSIDNAAYKPDHGYLFDPKLRILGQEQDLWDRMMLVRAPCQWMNAAVRILSSHQAAGRRRRHQLLVVGDVPLMLDCFTMRSPIKCLSTRTMPPAGNERASCTHVEEDADMLGRRLFRVPLQGVDHLAGHDVGPRELPRPRAMTS